MNKLLLGLLIFGMLLIHCLIGGTRLVFSIPTYTVLGIAAVLSAFVIQRAKATPSLACLLVSGVFFTYILVRAANSPIDYLWWQDFYMVLGCLIVYALTAFFFTSTRHRGVIVAALLGIAVIHVFVGLRQFSVGDEWMPFGFIRGTGNYGRRASGMLIHSIHLAGYLEAVAVFALSFALWSTWKTWARLLMGYLAILCYVGIAITGSRGGYISAAFSLFVFTLFCLHVYRKVRPTRFPRVLAISAVVFTLGIGGAVLLMSQSDFLRHRLELLSGQLEEKNRDIRIYNWQAALDQFRVEPIFGTGAGTHLHYGRLFRRPQLQADPIHAHSDYLELIAEYGIVGGVGMAMFLLVHFWSGLRAYALILRRDLRGISEYEPAGNDALALQIGAFSAIAAYLVHSITDFNLHVPGNALLFAFIFGLLASPGAEVRTGKAAVVSRALRYIVPALGVYVLVVAPRRLPGEYYIEKARVALRDQLFEESLALSQKALTFEERNPNLYFYIGSARRGMARQSRDLVQRRAELEAAAQSYLAALAIFPQDENALVRLAQALAQLGHFKQAEKAYLKALEMDPNLGVLHAYYARHLAFVGREKEAEERFAHALSLDASEKVHSMTRGTSLDPAVREE